jgi:hypothetical protein
VNIAYDARDETSAAEGRERIAEQSEVAAMPLRVLAALLFLGGIVYALLSGNWGIGAIVFSRGAGVGPAPCGAEPARLGYRVGAHTVRRVCHRGRHDLDVSRRCVGSFFFLLLLPPFN